MNPSDYIQPWPENPAYWMYKQKPVLLLGGSKEDNLFQIDRLEEHLDEMAAVGANFIRNTMSDRDPGDARAYHRGDHGQYDLTRWNEEYWTRFSNLLRWTAERDIIVQIEVWDRFDHSAAFYRDDPYRPANNVNYTCETSGLADEYPEHPSADKQPFFHTIPGMPRYEKRLDLLRGFQEAFVDKMLSYSLEYGHVLYCMNNETSTPEQWGWYWIEFIQKRAADKGVPVQTTDMFDDIWQAEESEKFPVNRDDTRHCTFVDISQVNSRNFGEDHWRRVNWLVAQGHQHPRPVGCTKTYGGGYKGFGTGGLEDGVERFIRNIFAGCHGSRFHRPDCGNGLNHLAQGAIKALRCLESLMKLWDLAPRMDLLSDRAENAAYCAAVPGECYAVYFTYGRSVTIDLSACRSAMALRWISVTTGEFVWGPRDVGPGVVEIKTPAAGGWIAAIVRQSNVCADRLV